uniref:A disintegrin and metalloproteinase with thrombospondin motifs 19 n=1 Tax=Sphaerodactylus townsendi TaxID=933632 RepID=A0ACB8ERQ8_9SAUR
MRTTRAEHKSSPAGIAYLNGMCSEKRKCIIAEDNGLNLAFTIAHEMGHKLMLTHENVDSCPEVFRLPAIWTSSS